MKDVTPTVEEKAIGVSENVDAGEYTSGISYKMEELLAMLARSTTSMPCILLSLG